MDSYAQHGDAEYLTIDQLAHRWKVSSFTIRRRANLGQLKATYFGPRSVRFKMEDVLRFEAQGEGALIPHSNRRSSLKASDAPKKIKPRTGTK